MESTVEAVCNQLARNRLLEAEAVRGLRGQWRGEAGTAADNVGEFRKWLVKKGNVTEFQLDLLDRGYADFLNFGEYKIQGKIGNGRMAGVYKAVHPLGQTVAIKVLPPSKSKHTQVLGRFLREARLATRLDHDNVVRTFQNGVHSGMHYLVMEYLDGETLEETLKRRKRLPLEEALAVAAQALQGLDHLHEVGLVHRDLKPGNLMLVHGENAAPGDTTLQQTVKILDMGLGRALFDEGTPGAPPAGAPDAANLTCEGAILGTLNYMAPEQARDAHAADIRSDIYSLGCVLFEMLCGQAPFHDANVARQLRRHAEEKPRAVHELVPGLPAAVDQIVQKMLAKDPALRYSTPGQVLRDIKALAPPPAAKPVRPKKSYLTWLETQRQEEAPLPGNTELPAPQTHVSPTAMPAPAASVATPVAPKPRTPMPVAAPLPPVAPVIAAPSAPKQPNAGLTFVKNVFRRVREFGWGKRDWIAAAVGATALLVVQVLFKLIISLK